MKFKKLAQFSTIIQIVVWAVTALSVVAIVWLYPTKGKELIAVSSIGLLLSQAVLQVVLWRLVGCASWGWAFYQGEILALALWIMHGFIIVGTWLLLYFLHSVVLPAVLTGYTGSLIDQTAYLLLAVITAGTFVWLCPKIDRSLMLDKLPVAQQPHARLIILLANFGAYLFTLIWWWLVSNNVVSW